MPKVGDIVYLAPGTELFRRYDHTDMLFGPTVYETGEFRIVQDVTIVEGEGCADRVDLKLGRLMWDPLDVCFVVVDEKFVRPFHLRVGNLVRTDDDEIFRIEEIDIFTNTVNLLSSQTGNIASFGMISIH